MASASIDGKPFTLNHKTTHEEYCRSLNSNPHFDERKVTCIESSVITPETCKLERFSAAIGLIKGTNIPFLGGFISAINKFCSPATISRITNDDIEWINGLLTGSAFS